MNFTSANKMLHQEVKRLLNDPLKRVAHILTPEENRITFAIYIDRVEEMIVTVAFDSDDATIININNIRIETLKGHGLSYMLLYCVLIFVYCRLRPNTETITLDDMSDKYRNFEKGENLYLNLGFKYVDETGPEMVGEFTEVLMKSLVNACRHELVHMERPSDGDIPHFAEEVVDEDPDEVYEFLSLA